MKKIKKPLLENFVYPLQEFIKTESAGGIVLMVVTVLALIWSNSPFKEYYFKLWETPVSIAFGPFILFKSVIHWINDGLMAVFFFLVGLEIKREMIAGEFSTFEKAALPHFAALGGMLVPAAVFFIFNTGQPGEAGWGIPMATDIAFALGVITLLGKRVPVALKLFLTALAIADDIGAVIVIAVFYTAKLKVTYLLISLGIFGVLALISFLKVHSYFLFFFFGIIMWLTMLKSGIHATIAGILLSIVIPAKSKRTLGEYINSNKSLLKQMLPLTKTKVGGLELEKDTQASILTIEKNCHHVLSPLQRIEHGLHYWVAFLIVPIFAFANAGVHVDSKMIANLFNPVTLGIIAGLVLGKSIGITFFSWLAVKLKIAKKPEGTTWMQFIGVGLLGGIGFTMSIFISSLAFFDAELQNVSKIGILIGSTVSGILGYFILKQTTKNNVGDPV